MQQEDFELGFVLVGSQDEPVSLADSSASGVTYLLGSDTSVSEPHEINMDSKESNADDSANTVEAEFTLASHTPPDTAPVSLVESFEDLKDIMVPSDSEVNMGSPQSQRSESENKSAAHEGIQSAIQDQNAVVYPAPKPKPPPLKRLLYSQLERCLKLYHDDRLFESKDALAALVSQLSMFEMQPGLRRERGTIQQVREALSANPEVKDIQLEVKRVHNIIARLNDHNGWKKVVGKKGIETYYRHESTGYHSIKVVGDVRSSLFNVLGVANEIDLLPSIMPVKLFTRTIKQVSRFSKLVYLRLKAPWPFDDRDMVFLAEGVDMLHEDQVVIMGRSVTSFPGVELPPVPSGCTRLYIREFGSVLMPLNKATTSIAAVANFNLNMKIIPSRLLNFLTRQLAFYGFEMFRKQALELAGSHYEEKMSTQPETYSEIQSRLAEYWSKKNQHLSPDTENQPPPNHVRPSIPQETKKRAAAAANLEQSDSPGLNTSRPVAAPVERKRNPNSKLCLSMITEYFDSA